jgi:hypothetical protein
MHLPRQAIYFNVIRPAWIGLEEGGHSLPGILCSGDSQGCPGFVRLRMMRGDALLPDLYR